MTKKDALWLCAILSFATASLSAEPHLKSIKIAITNPTGENRPAENIVLSVAHFSYREPNAADLRFEAYTTLAYGGRGLSYFTYTVGACQA